MSKEATRRKLESELEAQKAMLETQVRSATNAALEVLSLHRWIARYPIEAAMIAVTGMAILTEAAEKRRTARAAMEWQPRT